MYIYYLIHICIYLWVHDGLLKWKQLLWVESRSCWWKVNSFSERPLTPRAAVMTGLDSMSGTTSRAPGQERGLILLPRAGPLCPGIHQLTAGCRSCGAEDDGRLPEQVTGINVRSETMSPHMDSLLTFHLDCRRLYFSFINWGSGWARG